MIKLWNCIISIEIYGITEDQYMMPQEIKQKAKEYFNRMETTKGGKREEIK